MTKDDFTLLFHSVLFTPAERLGYRFVRKSQTLAFDAGELSVLLVRLGGRMAIPGAISHVLCARHRFLRELLDMQLQLTLFQQWILRPKHITQTMFHVVR